MTSAVTTKSVPAPLRKAVRQWRRAFGGYRSNGVTVTAATHGLIARGNAARGTGDWERAAALYADALKDDPTLVHIWIQLGHMRKQMADYDGAMDAYASAEAADPSQSEAAVEQGHIAKLQKLGGAAIQHYMRAYQSDAKDPDALRELLNLLERGAGVTRETLVQALKLEKRAKPKPAPRPSGDVASLTDLLARAADLQLDPTQIAALEAARSRLLARDGGVDPAAIGNVVVFDASDLISYFGNARLPTGIQRVQIATITGALDSKPEGSVRICCFSDQGDSWAEVPADSFQHLAALSLASGDRTDPEWLEAYSQIKIEISLAPPFLFPDQAFLINLGTSWWLQNYFMFVREAKRLHGISYVPFVHDFIPVMTPEHCVKELTQDFISWALGVFQHADFYLVNSQATKRDLVKVAAMLGHDVAPDAVSVIPLDAQFRAPDATTASPARLRDWQLAADDYVLIVSTIESRKNHIGALDAWLALIEQHGARKIPKLVCVGNRGWLNDAVYARIDRSSALRSRVVMLSGLSDEELGLLYKHSRFTLYPSNYEGWGLPVTESLCYGKVPLISNSSSLPEAGGEFAVYFEAGSTRELTEQAERLIFDDAERQRLEARIVADFRPRTWQDVAAQIATEIQAFVGRGQQEGDAGAVAYETIEPATLGAYYPITRNFETRIWKGLASAEIYRSGTGWWWPDDWGCWTKPGGGSLALRLRDQNGPVRGFIQILAPPDAPTQFTISANVAGFRQEGVLQPNEYRWIAIDLPDLLPPEGLHIRIEGSFSVDLSERTGGLDRRIIALGVSGFYFCHADDLIARANFLEAVTVGGLKQLAFNREPALR